jgi:hypothetical protein
MRLRRPTRATTHSTDRGARPLTRTFLFNTLLTDSFYRVPLQLPDSDYSTKNTSGNDSNQDRDSAEF